MSYQISYDYWYTHIDTDANSFDELPQLVQDDLITWLNVQFESKDDGKEDKKRLLDIYQSGSFCAWDCPECGERVYDGQPDNWDYFQGSLNRDFSYFGDEDKYTSEYIKAICDNCRAFR